MTDVDAFIKQLREEVQGWAENLNGGDVTKALFELTDEMSAAGIDRAWEAAKFKDRGKAGELFCITWLTLLAVKLSKKV